MNHYSQGTATYSIRDGSEVTSFQGFSSFQCTQEKWRGASYAKSCDHKSVIESCKHNVRYVLLSTVADSSNDSEAFESFRTRLRRVYYTFLFTTVLQVTSLTRFHIPESLPFLTYVEKIWGPVNNEATSCSIHSIVPFVTLGFRHIQNNPLIRQTDNP